jgi:hypothetical protein
MFLIDFASQSASTFAEIYLIYYFNTQYNPQKLYFSVMCSVLSDFIAQKYSSIVSDRMILESSHKELWKWNSFS